MNRVIIPFEIYGILGSLDEWHKSHIRKVIDALPDTSRSEPEGTCHTFVGNYRITFEILEKLGNNYWAKLGDSSISITSVDFEQRLHLAVVAGGEFSDSWTHFKMAFLNPQKAEDYCRECLLKATTLVKISEELREHMNQWSQENPAPSGSLEQKPKIKLGQSQKDHIEQNLNPWKERRAEAQKKYEVLRNEYYAKREAEMNLWLKTNHSEEIVKYDIDVESMDRNFYRDDVPEYKVTNMELVV